LAKKKKSPPHPNPRLKELKSFILQKSDELCAMQLFGDEEASDRYQSIAEQVELIQSPEDALFVVGDAAFFRDLPSILDVDGVLGSLPYLDYFETDEGNPVQDLMGSYVLQEHYGIDLGEIPGDLEDVAERVLDEYDVPYWTRTFARFAHALWHAQLLLRHRHQVAINIEADHGFVPFTIRSGKDANGNSGLRVELSLGPRKKCADNHQRFAALPVAKLAVSQGRRQGEYTFPVETDLIQFQLLCEYLQQKLGKGDFNNGSWAFIVEDEGSESSDIQARALDPLMDPDFLPDSPDEYKDRLVADWLQSSEKSRQGKPQITAAKPGQE